MKLPKELNHYEAILLKMISFMQAFDLFKIVTPAGYIPGNASETNITARDGRLIFLSVVNWDVETSRQETFALKGW